MSKRDQSFLPEGLEPWRCDFFSWGIAQKEELMESKFQQRFISLQYLLGIQKKLLNRQLIQEFGVQQRDHSWQYKLRNQYIEELPAKKMNETTNGVWRLKTGKAGCKGSEELALEIFNIRGQRYKKKPAKETEKQQPGQQSESQESVTYQQPNDESGN